VQVRILSTPPICADSQVVRRGTANPIYAGSTPVLRSKLFIKPTYSVGVAGQTVNLLSRGSGGSTPSIGIALQI
jgi:hypothetical protein